MISVLLIAALVHPVHETVAEVEWNGESKRLEVALRLDPLDEQWITEHFGHRNVGKRWQVDYLRRKLRVSGGAAFQSAEAGKAKYHWVGREDKTSAVWWYFEIEPLEGRRPRWIDSRLLMERNDSYVNRVLVLGSVPRHAITLTSQRPKGSLDRAEPAESDDAESDDEESDGGGRLDR